MGSGIRPVPAGVRAVRRRKFRRGAVVIINVNDSYRITTDAHQFVLQFRAEPKEGTERKGDGWRGVAYASNIHELWDVLFHKQVLAIEGEYPFEALTTLTTALDSIQADIKAAMATIDYGARRDAVPSLGTNLPVNSPGAAPQTAPGAFLGDE
jgi:hypothetical protein